jgi:predicted RNase H-like HicB family nuclease
MLVREGNRERMTASGRNRFFVQLTARLEPGEQDEGGFVAFCPELGISSQGEDLDETQANIIDAIVEFLTTLSDTGDLVPFLNERRIALLAAEPTGPVQMAIYPQRREMVSAFVASIGESVAVA